LGGLAPGTVSFSLTAENRRPSQSFTILRVEHDGIVRPRGLEIKPGEQASGVKVIVSYGTGSVRGEVKVENGPLTPDGRVVVWLKKWVKRTRTSVPTIWMRADTF